MNSRIITKEKVEVDVTSEVSSFTVKVGTVVAAMIGIWALTALASALVQVGPLTMLRGYLTAITGF